VVVFVDLEAVTRRLITLLLDPKVKGEFSLDPLKHAFGSKTAIASAQGNLRKRRPLLTFPVKLLMLDRPASRARRAETVEAVCGRWQGQRDEADDRSRSDQPRGLDILVA
jgi:hypothetical protein